MDPLVWAPHVIQDLNEVDLRLYLEFSRTACIRGGGCNVEIALQVLFLSNGDINLAIEKLLLTNAQKQQQHQHNGILDDASANSFDQTIWTEDEVHTFERSIECHGKNFTSICQDIKTKSVKECVEFYYLWKKSPNRNSSPLTTATAISTPPLPPSASASASSLLAVGISTKTISPQHETFPCKVCGRIFEKIKSRSAHMKRHKNER